MAVNQIVEQLKSEQERLQGIADKLNEQLAINTAELKRVQTALSALDSKPATKTSRKSLKPAATKNDVIAAMETVLAQNSPIERDALKSIVQDAVAESGKSKQGFALRFAEAMKDQRFSETADGVQLHGHAAMTTV